MACGCSGGNGGPVATGSRAEEQEYTVKLPNGRTEVVRGEHAAKVAVTMAGGGTYSAR